MITIGLTVIRRKGSPLERTYTNDEANAFLARRTEIGDVYKWDRWGVPSCRCCGEPAWENDRCTKHQDRNPCIVEGCRRTRAAKGYLSDDWVICGEHFKRYIRPGSPERKALNRLFRLAKKAGYERTAVWPEPLERRYWMLWKGIVRRVRERSSAGHIDQAEIERLFGWG